jgi:hypothetical protein
VNPSYEYLRTYLSQSNAVSRNGYYFKLTEGALKPVSKKGGVFCDFAKVF